MAEARDEYSTIRTPVRIATKVQGSRFIAEAVPARENSEIEEFLASVRREFFDATHHCYAFRLGLDGTRFRANDDGEPGGSAGKPILAAIDRADLTDVLLVVTRYFGGTKLGVGGLARAYGAAAEEALRAAPRVTLHLVDTVEISFPHASVNPVMRVIKQCGARIAETQYGEEVHLRLEIRSSRSAQLRAALVEQTGGKVVITSRPVLTRPSSP